jgi:hypothetical protein
MSLKFYCTAPHDYEINPKRGEQKASHITQWYCMLFHSIFYWSIGFYMLKKKTKTKKKKKNQRKIFVHYNEFEVLL